MHKHIFSPILIIIQKGQENLEGKIKNSYNKQISAIKYIQYGK